MYQRFSFCKYFPPFPYPFLFSSVDQIFSFYKYFPPFPSLFFSQCQCQCQRQRQRSSLRFPPSNRLEHNKQMLEFNEEICTVYLVKFIPFLGQIRQTAKLMRKKGGREYYSIIVEPLFCTEAKQEKLSSRRRVEGGLLWIQRTKTFVDQAWCPVQWLMVAQRSVRRTKVELCSCNGCGCPLREMLLKMLPRHRAPVDLIKI